MFLKALPFLAHSITLVPTKMKKAPRMNLPPRGFKTGRTQTSERGEGRVGPRVPSEMQQKQGLAHDGESEHSGAQARGLCGLGRTNG